MAEAFLAYLGALFVISLSGALAPGPVTATAIAQGYRDPWAGTKVALGHAMVEIPLVAAIIVGVAPIVSASEFRLGIGLAGGAVLIALGLGLVREALRREAGARVAPKARSALLGGAVATLSNPYFFLWWGSIGVYLFAPAIALGLAALALSYFVHWSTDLVWDQMLSSATFRARRIWRPQTEAAIYALVGAFLVGTGIVFGLFSLLELLAGEPLSPIPGLSPTAAGIVLTALVMLLSFVLLRARLRSAWAIGVAAQSEPSKEQG